MKISPASLTLTTTLALATSAFAPTALGELRDVPVTGAAITTELTGTVEVVNLDKRMLTIRTPEGEFVVLHVPEEVTRLDEVKIGNTLDVSKTEAVLVDLQKGSDAGTVGMTEEREIARDPGAKPAGAIIDTLTLYGKIEAVDREASTVTVRGPNRTQVFTVEDQALLDSVAPGDGVIATYITAIDGFITFE
ncbi:copper-binding protein [Marichromatium bheemlicum]|uniref:Copper-binding protein n=2 Tax=Marichromatium bheemlicum TaxID=365339 RepID=A0ABX1I4B7_9GAMM|nr:copper-binding protein [Marichromatium bheemlicum]